MSDRPTPETDAFTVKFKSVCGSKAWVPTDICRRFERERDEARNKMADALQEVDLRTLDYERMKQERDEVLEALMRIEEIFIDGEDTYEDWKKMGDIAVKALEEK